MKFKQTFHVFVDNFNIIYKQLLYRLIILAVTSIICTLGVYPFIKQLINSPQLNELVGSAKDFIMNLLNGEVSELSEISKRVQAAYADFMALLNTEVSHLVLAAFLLLIIFLISRWFTGIGNYATASVINDRMALRANSPFFSTMIRTLKDSTVYNAIYVPLSILYDIAVAVAMFFLLFTLLSSVIPFLLSVFLFILVIIVSLILKMTFTTDWLPALIRGKKGQLGSFKYTFSQRGKNTLSVMSNFSVLTILVFAINAAAVVLTFGVGLLITIPSSYVILICFEFVNYYNREGLKYFIDDRTIVSTAGDKPVTRESFFRGDDE
ncbi:MAG: hypothetical protein K2K80_01630 [Clostridia bacterium]|nr:hypothetical protein [Clostridia bacterium]